MNNKTTMWLGLGVVVVVILVGVMSLNNNNNNTKQNNMTNENSNNEQGVMVGGAAMLPSRDIVDNAVLASNVTTVVAAVKAAGLVDTLKSAGPFTVFAPTNAAFAKLPAMTSWPSRTSASTTGPSTPLPSDFHPPSARSYSATPRKG